MVGKIINNYIIERKLGEGGMGNVYYARHNLVDRIVAIKVLHQNLFTNENIRNRFKNEANALIKLGHPNIVKIYDYVEYNNFACLIMEYIEGFTLDEYITKISGPLVASKALNIICKILDAVQYAHDNQIYHRDIKPGNIMVSKDGLRVTIMDFGIAKIMDTSSLKATQANTQLGTPFYMSPEQVKGATYTKESDVYSIGVTLFEMVTGKCPYSSITNLFELQNKIVNEPLPPTSNYYPDVSPHLQAGIIKATEKVPEKRFNSCSAFKAFLLDDNVNISKDKKPNKKISIEKRLPISEPLKNSAKTRKRFVGIIAISIFLLSGIIISALFYFKKAPDIDGDGVPDSIDICPNVPGLSSTKGCPDTPAITTVKVVIDIDGDGIPDTEDKCPNVAGIAGFDGCPDTTKKSSSDNLIDSDGDGVADVKDNCPKISGLAQYGGCPEPDNFRYLSKSQVLGDLMGNLTCNGEQYKEQKQVQINTEIPNNAEQKIINLEETKTLYITFTGNTPENKCVFQMFYIKTEKGFKFKDLIQDH